MVLARMHLEKVQVAASISGTRNWNIERRPPVLLQKSLDYEIALDGNYHRLLLYKLVDA